MRVVVYQMKRKYSVPVLIQNTCLCVVKGNYLFTKLFVSVLSCSLVMNLLVFNPFVLLCASFSCYILWILHLFNRYLDRLADSLQQKLKVSEKLLASIKTMADKRQAASTEQQDLEPKLEVIRMKTKELQVQVPSFVSLITFALSDNEFPIIALWEK